MAQGYPCQAVGNHGMGSKEDGMRVGRVERDSRHWVYHIRGQGVWPICSGLAGGGR